ncbi:MAG: hypothetical protein ACXAC2_06060, partial [Candidatus Kariarchaeaceae archaeon]
MNNNDFDLEENGDSPSDKKKFIEKDELFEDDTNPIEQQLDDLDEDIFLNNRLHSVKEQGGKFTSNKFSEDPIENELDLDLSNHQQDDGRSFVTKHQVKSDTVDELDQIRKDLGLDEYQPIISAFFENDEKSNVVKNKKQKNTDLDKSFKVEDRTDPILIENIIRNEKIDVSWSGRVQSGGGSGTGFVTFPKDLSQDAGFNHGDRVKLNIQIADEDRELLIDTKFRINKNRQGFSIPKQFMIENDLKGNNYDFSASEEDGFKTTISKYKQMIIPVHKLEEYKIEDNDIFNVEVKTADGKVFEES